MRQKHIFTDLQTKRLNLKCINYEDADFFFKEFSNENVNKYLYDVEPFTSIDEAKKWISLYVEPEPRNQHRWIIVLKETGESIGTCGFHRWNKEKKEVEIGYDLYPTYWKHGYTTEALTKIINFAKEEMKINSIYAHISVDNIPSIKTALKQGFINTGDNYYEEFHGKKYLHNVYRLDL